MDLTVLYYSALRITPQFGDAVRRELLASIQDRYPIITIAHGQLPAWFTKKCERNFNIGN